MFLEVLWTFSCSQAGPPEAATEYTDLRWWQVDLQPSTSALCIQAEILDFLNLRGYKWGKTESDPHQTTADIVHYYPFRELRFSQRKPGWRFVRHEGNDMQI